MSTENTNTAVAEEIPNLLITPSAQEYLHEFINNVKHSTLKFDELEIDLNITASYAIGQYMLFEDAKAGLEKAINDKMKLSFSNDLSIAVSKEAKYHIRVRSSLCH